MIKTSWFCAGCFLVAVAGFGCGGDEKATTGAKKSGAREAVEDVVTGDFKIYEGAKKSLEKIQRETEERMKDAEKEFK